MSKQDESAFPQAHMGASEFGLTHTLEGGLTKRELFAAMAMQKLARNDRGAYSQNDIERGTHMVHAKFVAQSACDHADALLAELAKERQ